MSATEAFFDTNVALYLVSGDPAKADRAEALFAAGGAISVQVLNEFAAVASRKYGKPWAEIRAVLRELRNLCRVEPLSLETHERTLDLAERYRIGLYDAAIAASALIAGCRILYTEDLQAGLVLERRLRVVDPFQRAS